jgi:hypothetical protein
LSFSAYHPELWQPAWGIRLILEALISFLPTPADGAIGALDWSSNERKRLAKSSQSWKCPHCGPICTLIPEVKEKDGDAKKKSTTSYSKEIAELHRLQQIAEANRGGNGKQDSSNTDGKEQLPRVGGTLQMEELEEEIVFGEDNDEDEEPESLGESSREEENDKATTDRDNAINISNHDSETHGETSHAEPNGAEEERATAEDVEATPAPSAISRLYDPLLNILIALLIAICYLLIQKWMELSRELQELEAWEYTQQLEQSHTSFNEMATDEAATEL